MYLTSPAAIYRSKAFQSSSKRFKTPECLYEGAPLDLDPGVWLDPHPVFEMRRCSGFSFSELGRILQYFSVKVIMQH